LSYACQFRFSFACRRFRLFFFFYFFSRAIAVVKCARFFFLSFALIDGAMPLYFTPSYDDDIALYFDYAISRIRLLFF